jgi:hypothetical protein
MKITRKRFMESALVMIAGAVVVNLPSSEGNAMMQRIVNLQDMVGANVFQKAGLHKLSEHEQMILADWINDYMNQITKSVEAECQKKKIR